MTYVIEHVRKTPERAEVDAILRDYYDMSNERLVADGGPAFSVKDAIQDFWDTLPNILPPKGALVLARSEDGHLVGCGTLARKDATTGEMKRLFVRPETRGAGLGRALTEARLAVARDLGFKTIIADTLRRNSEMQRLYASLGFQRVPPSETSGTVAGFPELAPFLYYYRLDISR